MWRSIDNRMNGPQKGRTGFVVKNDNDGRSLITITKNLKYNNDGRSETESERDLDGIDVVSFFISFCWTCDFDCCCCCCYFSVFVFLCFFNGLAKSGRSKSILRYYTTTNIEVKTIPSTDEQMMNLTNAAFDISTLSSLRLNFFCLEKSA